jgi:hypothetical protein
VINQLEQRRMTRELATALVEKEEALKHVEQLRGMLPICAYCQRIRDDKNYWSEVVEYFSTHSEMRFSHGICPKLLPDGPHRDGPASRRLTSRANLRTGASNNRLFWGYPAHALSPGAIRRLPLRRGRAGTIKPDNARVSTECCADRSRVPIRFISIP